MSPKATRLAAKILRIPGHAFSSASRYGIRGFPHRCACGLHSNLYDLTPAGMNQARDWYRAHKAAVVALGKTQEAQR